MGVEEVVEEVVEEEVVEEEVEEELFFLFFFLVFRSNNTFSLDELFRSFVELVLLDRPTP